MGAASAPALLSPTAIRASRVRAFGTVVLVAVALLSIPLYLSNRYARKAYGESTANPEAAIADFDRAAALNPLEAEPLFAKGSLEARLGNQSLALEALNQAIKREPENYAGYYLLAQGLAGSDPVAAIEALENAQNLNPTDPEIRALLRRLNEPEGK